MIRFLYDCWVRYLTQKYKIFATIFLLPFLYFFGFIIAQPITLLKPSIPQEDISLIGTIFTFIIFILILPSWIRVRWKAIKPWRNVGIFDFDKTSSLRLFGGGIAWSFILICVVLIVMLWGSWGEWIGEVNSFEALINAIVLGIGVGFAEELIFRGWLWGEMNILFGSKCGVFIQAAIFSLAHLPFTLGLMPVLALSLGLFLLGLVLSIRRVLDNGSLLGCMSCHGGLVSMWFLLRSGLITISGDRPVWLFGPGDLEPNPIGGLVAILAFAWIIWHHRTAFAIMREPLRGARSASSNGATP